MTFSPTGSPTGPLALAIFDVDGTLVDSQHYIHDAMTAAFEALALPPPDLAAVRRIVGLSLPVAIAELAPEGAPVAMMVEAYKDTFSTRRSKDAAPMFDGALNCLDELGAEAELLLGIATGKGRRGLDIMVEMHGWHGRFTTVQTADGNPSKPHPGMLMRALAETGMPADQAVMIGDTSFDMEMGRAAGMQAWGVAWGYHEVAALEKAGATRIFTDYGALTGALLDWHRTGLAA